MISMNFIVCFSHFGKLIIYLSTNFNVKIRYQKSARSFPTAGLYGKCQKSTFYTLKAPIRKINIFLHLKNQNNHNITLFHLKYSSKQKIQYSR